MENGKLRLSLNGSVSSNVPMILLILQENLKMQILYKICIFKVGKVILKGSKLQKCEKPNVAKTGRTWSTSPHCYNEGLPTFLNSLYSLFQIQSLDEHWQHSVTSTNPFNYFRK